MRHGRAQSRSTGFFATAALLSGALILLSQLPPMAGPRAALRGALTPFETFATGFEGAGGAALAIFGDIATLRAENQRLAAENARLRAQVATLQAAGAENDSLRRDLAFERSFGHRMLAADVIGRGPDAFARTLTLDRGTADGLRAGMVVVTGAGLVGRVVEAGPRWATVQTVADPLTRVNAYLVKAGAEGTVSGGPGALRMDLTAAADASVASGDWALTSGLGGTYPRGIPVGQVIRFDRRPAAVTSVAELAWPNDVSGLVSVLVITDFQPR
jgi:rod shape-determining protein MreC